MTDEAIVTILLDMLREYREAGELGGSPYQTCVEYVERTATTIEACARAGTPIAAGPLKGTDMVVVEIPQETFDRLVANDRAWRRHTGTLLPERSHAPERAEVPAEQNA